MANENRVVQVFLKFAKVMYCYVCFLTLVVAVMYGWSPTIDLLAIFDVITHLLRVLLGF